MVSNRKRIAIAAFVSLLGCTGTYLWYWKTLPKVNQDSETNVIAFIETAKKDVQRKGANNTLWEPAERLDRLRAGDSIRTSVDSEARIKFYSSARYVDVEPESMMVIQKQSTNIKLELLEGSLFVNGVDKNSKEALTLKSKSGEVDLSKATTQLSGSSNAVMDLKVIQGSAQVLNASGKLQTISEGSEGGFGKGGLKVEADQIKIIAPDLTQPVFVNPSNPEPIRFRWSGIPANAQATLQYGYSRKSLLKTITAKTSSDELSALWKPGTYYWQIVGIEPQSKKQLIKSPIYKTIVIQRFPPSPIYPGPNLTIQTKGTFETISLRWNAGIEFKEVGVQLTNETTKQVLFNKRFSSNIDSETVANLPLGKYSWQLTGYFANNSAPAVGPRQTFSIDKKIARDLAINWNSNLKPIQYFVNTEPKLTLMWDPDEMRLTKKWKVYITPSEGLGESGKNEIFETRQIKFEKVVAKPGRYLAYVEAFDDDGDKIGKTEQRNFQVDVLPLLPPPLLQPVSTKEFKANLDGSLILEWNAVEGAKQYEIQVLDSAETIVSTKMSSELSAVLENLMPGNYSVQILTIDNYNRKGEPSEKRLILVPDKSGITAPKLKTIKVN